ncbi:hypothetical protein AAE478_010452 [Parahypoxylon ruwenzoriense]
MFHYSEGLPRWIPHDGNSPYQGWPRQEFGNVSSGAATEDILGKLFYYLQGVIERFYLKIRHHGIRFEIIHEDTVTEGSDRFSILNNPGEEYDRILTPHTINEHKCPGISDTFPKLSSQISHSNPHATYITYLAFTNHQIRKFRRRSGDNVPKVGKWEVYIPEPNNERVWDAVKLLRHELDYLSWDFGVLFNLFMERHFHQNIRERYGLVSKNKLFDPWPLLPKSLPGEAGAVDEFGDHLAQDFTFPMLRFVEWRRIHSVYPNYLNNSVNRQWWSLVKGTGQG